jgi:WD40 repeat protein
MALSPRGTMIATVNTAGRGSLRTLERDWAIDRFLDFTGFLRAVAFSPDGQLIAAAGNEPFINLWRTESSGVARRLPVPIRNIRHLQYSPDGRTLALTTTLDGTILLYDLASEQVSNTFKHDWPVTSVCFSPDGRQLASAGRDDTSITFWDLKTGAARRLPIEVRGDKLAMAYSPDGKYLATVQFLDNCARLWDSSTGQMCRRFEARRRPLNSVAFSPDSQTLAVSGNGETLSLWQVATGKHLIDLDGDALCLHNIVFSHDGQTLFATGDDDDIRIWDLGDLRSVAGTLRVPFRSTALGECLLHLAEPRAISGM